MTIGGLAPTYRGRVTLPVLGTGHAGPCADLVTVRLVSGQSAEGVRRPGRTWPTGSGPCSCRIRTARPGLVVLELVRRDALAAVIPALPIPAVPDLRALPVGPARGRRGVHDPAARHAPADRRVRPGRGRLVHVGPGPGLLPAMAAGLVRVLAV